MVFDARPQKWPTDRGEVLEWIKQGRDPFQPVPANSYKTAFQEASERKDLELLLQMVAKPGTAWTKRFLFCRTSEADVPLKGRACTSSFCGNYLYAISMEALEVLMMNGYKHCHTDIINMCDSFVLDSSADEDPSEYHLLKMLKLCMATAGTNLATRGSSSDTGKIDVDGLFDLNLNYFSFCTGLRPRRIELARVLANPNYCGGRGFYLYHRPPLFYAICLRDKEIVKFLIENGAELPSLFQDFQRNADGAQEIVEISPLSLAEEHGMLEVLSLDPRPATTPVVVNTHEYIHQLQLEITKPLRLAISEILVATFMRAPVGHTPPVGIISSFVFSFCNFLEYLPHPRWS
jgi:hypothetical protein